MKTNKEVDQYVKTIRTWKEEIKELRAIILTTELEECLKWGKPCYQREGKNIVIIQPFKASLALMFFKGMLLKDKKEALVDVGPNSQSARRMEFTCAAEIKKQASTIKACIKEAITIETSGVKVPAKSSAMPVVSELESAFTKNARLKKAFYALTPGRQRAYLLHFSGAKQSATRAARIDKCTARILEGRGLGDR